MWRGTLFVIVVLVSACGAYSDYRKDPSAPGGPNACLDERKECRKSSACCSGWCVNGVCERQMSERAPSSSGGTTVE
jgi:hypothetical protein